jgi:hypothetical protein
MKKGLYLMLAATSAFFFACSDSSSSDSGDNGSITVEASGSITVDAEKKTAIIVVDNNEDVCVNENNTYSWKNVDFGADTSYSKYLFVGDTLVIIDCEEMNSKGDMKYCDDVGQMLVGGKAGDINGTWKSVLCSYDVEDSVSSCFKSCDEVGGKLTEEELERIYEEMYSKMAELSDDDADEPAIDPKLQERMTCLEEKDMNRYAESVLKISGSSFSSKVTYNYGEKDSFDDYMNSKFMSKLYKSLANGDPEIPSASYLTEEDSSGVEKYIKSAKIEVTSQTKTSVTFKFADQTFSVNIKKLNRTMDGSEFDMVVTANSKSCELESEEGEVTKSTCKAEYGEFFDKDTERDAAGNKITIADYYEKSNGRDFERCTETMMDSVYAAIKGKGGSSSGGDCEELSTAYSRCMLMDYEDAADAGCSDIADEYADCVMGSYGSDTYDDDDWESLFKKAESSAELAKKKFLKNARKFARKMEKFAE